MPRDVVPSQDGNDEISHPIEPHNRVWTGPTVTEREEAPREVSWRRMFDRAVADLSKWTPSTAVDRMADLPSGLLEVYLLAEEANQGRPLILRNFPRPGLQARERYAGFSVPQPKAAKKSRKETVKT